MSSTLAWRRPRVARLAREDAVSFVASNGEIRGPYLEAALQQMRREQPDLQASDMELATAILAAEQPH